MPSRQTRVLVTHNISFLPQTDFVIVLADGQVSEMGPYSALLQHEGSFANFLHNYTLDEPQEHLGDSRIGICPPRPSRLPCPPSLSPVGVSRCLGIGPLLYHGGSGRPGPSVLGITRRKVNGMQPHPTSFSSLTGRPWISRPDLRALVFPSVKRACGLRS